MPKNESVFEIGLAMAGAISAGAYSAGVIDFLFQALDAWEKAKVQTPEQVPNHSVCIRAAAGASAGSITAALGMLAVSGGLQKQAFGAPKSGKQLYEFCIPALYTAWVTMPDMASRTGAQDLLSTTDLAVGAAPQSLLNARLLDDLLQVALRVPSSNGQPTVPAHGGPGLPYLPKRLHLYLTLSNMRGVPYEVSFLSGGRTVSHTMMSHGDRAHYIIEGIGTHGRENDWLSGDPGQLLKIASAPSVNGQMSEEWLAYGEAALASAAFPVGLAAKAIRSTIALYHNRSWPGTLATGSKFKPSWPQGWEPDRAFGFMSVDGGLIDNEPFEYARRAIMLNNTEANEREGDKATGAVVMVDPFPEPPDFSLDDNVLDASIVQVARALFPMLKNQARFKPDELVAALDDDVYSRWLIAPSRVGPPPSQVVEKYAIATGVLGGFGGFLDEAFRAHDYQLGRRNCQQFLKEIFVVSENNPIVKTPAPDGQATKWPAAAYADARFRKQRNGQWVCPVIPVVGDAEPEVPEPEWPRIDANRLALIEKRIAARVQYVVPPLLNFRSAGPHVNWGLRQAWNMFGERRLLDYVHGTIEADLIRRDQIAGWKTYSADARAVRAEFSVPGYDYRTVGGVKGIGQATGLDDKAVRAALSELRGRQAGLLWSGQVDDQECWTLTAKRPSWFERNNPLAGELRIG